MSNTRSGKDVFHHLVNVVFSPFVQRQGIKGITLRIMHLRKYFLLFTVLCLGYSNAVSSAETPSQTVENLHAALITSMQAGDEAGLSSRYGLLEPVILAEFDFESIARIIIGRDWKKLPTEKQGAFLQKFSDLSIATYASRFSGYNGESFVIDEIDEKRADQVILKTRLIKSDGDSVSLDYMLQATKGQWHILNVIAQGISDLSLKRSEYRSIIKQGGIDALLDALDSKLVTYKNKP